MTHSRSRCGGYGLRSKHQRDSERSFSSFDTGRALSLLRVYRCRKVRLSTHLFSIGKRPRARRKFFPWTNPGIENESRRRIAKNFIFEFCRERNPSSSISYFFTDKTIEATTYCFNNLSTIFQIQLLFLRWKGMLEKYLAIYYYICYKLDF